MSHKYGHGVGRILKVTALLGGASLINVLLGIVRVKVLAVQLGPAFFGMISLYTNFTTSIGAITSLGIGSSAVRNIAVAVESGNETRVAHTVSVLRRMVWLTGVCGLIATIGLSLPGSWWMFGEYDHAWAIAILGVTVLFAQIQSGQTALLSGLRRIGDLAMLLVIGGLLSTALAITLLLLLGEKGIVPFLIAVALGQLAASWWYSRKVKVSVVKVSWRECITESRDMVQLGLSMVVSGLMLTVSTLLILIILRAYEGVAAVGLYQSALTISSIYVGFILQSMSSDYFPRLVGIVENRAERNQVVDEQSDVAILLAVPGLVAALIFSSLLILLLYSARFDGASDILRWMILGMLGRIVSWPLGFILLAHGDKSAYIISELSTAIVHVALVWLGVHFLGPIGAGVAFAGQYLFYVLLIIMVTRARHEYIQSHSNQRLLIQGAALIFLAFGSTFITSGVYRYLIGVLLLLISIGWSLHGLVERLGFERFMNGMQKVVGSSVSFKLERALSRFYR